jgi:hypothetical protein
MTRIIIAFSCLLSSIFLWALNDKRPSYDYDVARAHEIKPHRRTIPLEGVTPGLNQLRLTLIVSFSPNLYPVYVRAVAYLAGHQGSEAAAEFQKIVDHRGVVVNAPIGALAHLGLARAYSLRGDNPKARASYDEFLTLWKDADPDVPIVKVAKAEYAKLQ